MDYHDQFRRAATGLGVPDHESALFAEVLRFRIRAGDQPGGPRAGRFGGLPHLPPETPWPCVVPGAPLTYLACVDCAALPEITGFGLPRSGSLLFFLSASAAVDSCSTADEQKFARVLHVPAGAETSATEPPPDEFDDEPLFGPEHDLFAQVEPHLPDWLDNPEDWLSDFEKRIVHGLPHRAELAALAERLWPGQLPEIGEDTVVLGGYAVSAQNSPEGILADTLTDDTLTDDAEQRVMREWVALAQFAVPHEDYVCGRFLIRHDDLAAARFDKALSFCEFTE